MTLKQDCKKLADVVHVLQTTQNLVISRCLFAEDGKEMYKELKRTCTAIVLLIKGPLKYLLMPLLGKNQLAITLHMYASIGPNLDNTHRGQI